MSWRQAVAAALPPGTQIVREAVLELPPQPRSVGGARAWVSQQVPDLDDDGRGVLLLLTSELVTNAVIHARTDVEVGVAATADDVVVVVHDLDLGRSELRPDEREGGRGLTLVRALSADSGLLVHPGGGKSAWFRLPCPHPREVVA